MQASTRRISSALTALVFSIPMLALAETPSPTYRDGDFWVFKIDRQSTAFISTRAIHGVYTVRFREGKFLTDADDVQYFSDTVPSVHGLTQNPPWLRFPLTLGKKWTYEFRYISDDGRQYSVSAEFLVAGPETVSVPGGTFEAVKIVRSDLGARAGRIVHTYFYSSKTGSVVKVDTHYQSGTTIKVELSEYGNKK
jgi:hypothetical protein